MQDEHYLLLFITVMATGSALYPALQSQRPSYADLFGALSATSHDGVIVDLLLSGSALQRWPCRAPGASPGYISASVAR